jgi:predicted 3-demethylubiquinone-9 3-methyltransferase (glyoxalase superfamily)
MSMPAITPFLMFTGQAEAAMRAYVALFPDSAIDAIDHYGAEAGGQAGTVRHARFTLAGRAFQCIDSPPVHAFGFTPSLSLHVTLESEADLDRVYAALAEGGAVMMPLGPYPFAKKYAWLSDRFGVSWQLSLP